MTPRPGSPAAALRLAIPATLLALFLALPARGYWPADGRALNVTEQVNYPPVLVPDGAGGAIVFWFGTRGVLTDLMADHVLASGDLDPTWPAEGRQYITRTYNGNYLTAVPDNSGGAIAVWEGVLDFGGLPYSDKGQAFALRITGGGDIAPGWPDSCLMLSRAVNGVNGGGIYLPYAVSDSLGGAIVGWQQAVGGFGASAYDYDLYAQRVLISGDLAWPDTGVVLSAAPNIQNPPMLVADGKGGAIAAWDDLRDVPNGTFSPLHLYAQRVDAAGQMHWGPDGLAVMNTAAEQHPGIASDGRGGAYFAFQSPPTVSTSDILMQHFDSAGAAWAAPVAVSTAAGAQDWPRLAPDGSNGVYCEWKDFRPQTRYLYLQRITLAGTVSPGWPANGFSPGSQVEIPDPANIVSDDAGGAMCVWTDASHSISGPGIFGRRVSGAALAQGSDSNGVHVCAACIPGYTQTPRSFYLPAVSDGSGGALLAWYDGRSPDAGIYAARISFGSVTGPAAIELGDVLTTVEDGAVRLQWSAFLDRPASFEVRRAETRNGAYAVVGAGISGGRGRNDFQWQDRSVRPATEYFYKLAWQDADGWRYSDPVRAVTSAARLSLRLGGANPATAGVRLEYGAPAAGSALLEILDLQGRRVCTLIARDVGAGSGSALWDGRLADGTRAPAGTYFARLRAHGEAHLKFVLLP